MPRLRLLPDVTTVYDESTAARVLEYLMKRDAVAIDSETTGLDKMRSQVICWSMATDEERYFLPWEMLSFFRPLFRRRDLTWFLANAKFDLHMFANMGHQIEGQVQDIIVMDAMDDDTRPHGLKDQARLAYDVAWGDFKELFLDPFYVSKELGLDKSSFAKFRSYSVGEKLKFVYAENPGIVHNYASCDAFFTFMRGMDLRNQLASTPLATEMVEGFSTLYDYFHLIEVPFTKVLWKMERKGVAVDLDRVKAIDEPLRNRIRGQELRVKDIVGPSFDPNKTEEVRALLFTKDGYNLKPVSYTAGKTPKPSVDENTLEILRDRAKDQKLFKLLEALLELRTLTKMHGTFVKGITKHIGPDGRVHAKTNQAEVRTGRLSYSEPNLQTIPKDEQYGLRTIFVAEEGTQLMGADYPQIQPRLAAVFAGEKKLIEDICKGFDIHDANVANMFGPRDPDATYEAVRAAKKAKDAKQQLTAVMQKLLKYRNGAKTVGLGVLFGEGKFKMANQLGISVDDAGELINTFFTTYPNIRKLIWDVHDSCCANEYGYTMLGRMRRLWRINNEYNQGIVAAEKRQGFNFLIQGSEAEIMKLAMLRIDSDKRWNELGAELALTVHDELLATAPTEVAQEAYKIQTELMADPLQWGPISIRLPVPLHPEGSVGYSWADVH